MDPVKILRRAWQILWSYRALWVFGLILALAGAGSSARNSSNNNAQYQSDSQSIQEPAPEDIEEAFQDLGRQIERIREEGFPDAGISAEEVTAILWAIGIFVAFSFLFSIVVAVGRYISETAVIRMVDEYEGTGSKMTVREGFRLGWSRASWRVFLINLLVNLPLILSLLLLLTIGIAVFLTAVQNNGQLSPVLIFGSIVTAFLLIFVAVIVTVVLGFLRNFFWRVAVLEDADLGESLRRGYQMVRENWKSVGVMWLVMIGLGIAWAIASLVLFILTLPVLLVTGVIGVAVAAIPALIASGVASPFMDGWLPWIVGALFASPIFLTIAFSPWLLLGSWQAVYTSTVWTLVYRELKALPALTNGSVPVVPPAS